MSKSPARLSAGLVVLVFLLSSPCRAPGPFSRSRPLHRPVGCGQRDASGHAGIRFRQPHLHHRFRRRQSVVHRRRFPFRVEEGLRRYLDLRPTSEFPQTPAGASPHRKALLMFRQTLDPDALYADAAIHGNGETALQYRRNKGDTTQDIEFNIGAPKTLRLEKRGDTITLFVSMHGEPLHQAGASIKLHLRRAVLCRHRRVRAQQGRGRAGHLRQRGVEASRAAGNAAQSSRSTAASRPSPSTTTRAPPWSY